MILPNNAGKIKFRPFFIRCKVIAFLEFAKLSHLNCVKSIEKPGTFSKRDKVSRFILLLQPSALHKRDRSQCDIGIICWAILLLIHEARDMPVHKKHL